MRWIDSVWGWLMLRLVVEPAWRVALAEYKAECKAERGTEKKAVT